MLEPRRQAMAHFPTEYYANGWPEGGLAICATFRSLLLQKSRLKSCSQYKCLNLLDPYKCWYSYTAILVVLYIYPPYQRGASGN